MRYKKGFRCARKFSFCLLGLLTLNANVSRAQETSGQKTGLGSVGNTRLTISPQLVQFDSIKKTASIEIWNQTPDTLDSEIVITAEAPLTLMTKRRKSDTTKKQSSGGFLGMITNTDSGAHGDGNTAIEASQSLVPWVKGAPPRVKLAPGAKQVVEVTLDIPDTVAAGQYSCWFAIFSTTVGPSKQKRGFAFFGPDGKPLSIPSFTKLTYTVGASR